MTVIVVLICLFGMDCGVDEKNITEIKETRERPNSSVKSRAPKSSEALISTSKIREPFAIVIEGRIVI